MKEEGAVLLLLLLCSVVVAMEDERSLKGTATIEVVQPSDTWLAVCALNEKYTMEPGSTIDIRLYIRNAMRNKTVKALYLEIPAVNGFTFSYEPDHLENLTTEYGEEVTFFDINTTADPGLPYGNYRLDFLIGTDEYHIGSFSDEVMIRVRPYSTELSYFYGSIVVLVLVALIARFLWIVGVNRRSRRRVAKDGRGITQYYYKGAERVR
jgi:uncharacterized membrane protein